MDFRKALATALSRPLSIISPKRAADYLASQERYAAVLSAYRGYGAASREGANRRWQPWDGRPDDLARRDARLIRRRARSMVRDNPNMAGALRKICSNVVFTGIMPQAQGPSRRANDRVEADWAKWARLTELREACCTAVNHLWTDGGFLLHTFPDRWLEKRGTVPLGFELLDMEALDVSFSGTAGSGNVIRSGIEFDEHGHQTAYYVYADALFGGRREGATFVSDPASIQRGGLKLRRIDARDCSLVMWRDSIGQSLPVSWLHAAIMTMHDFSEYQQSERIAARLAAAFAVFLKQDSQAAAMSLAGLGSSPLSGGAGTDGHAVSMEDFISSGRIDVLPPGYEIQIAENNRPASNFESFTKTTLRGASVASGMSYESYSNDYSGASYSSVRQAILEERRGYRMQQTLLAEKMLSPLWDAFVRWRSDFCGARETDVSVRWQFPGWDWVDPVKDAQAAQMRMDMGIDSPTRICAERGVDEDEIIRELVESRKKREDAGLSPKAGSAASEQQSADENTDDKESDE